MSSQRPTLVFNYSLQYQIEVNTYFNSIIEQLKNPKSLTPQLKRQYRRHVYQYNQLKFYRSSVAELLLQFFQQWKSYTQLTTYSPYLMLEKDFIRKYLRSLSSLTLQYQRYSQPYKCHKVFKNIVKILRSQTNMVSIRYVKNERVYSQKPLHVYQQFTCQYGENLSTTIVNEIYKAVIALRIMQLTQSYDFNGKYPLIRADDKDIIISNRRPIVFLFGFQKLKAQSGNNSVLSLFTFIMLHEISRKFNVSFEIFTKSPKIQPVFPEGFQVPIYLIRHITQYYKQVEMSDSEFQKSGAQAKQGQIKWQQDDMPLLKFVLPQDEDDNITNPISNRSEVDRQYGDSSSQIEEERQDYSLNHQQFGVQNRNGDYFESDSSSMMD